MVASVNNYEEFRYAVDNCADSIQVLADIEIPSKLVVHKNCHIDLGKCTLTLLASGCIFITKCEDVLIENGTVENSAGLGISVVGTEASPCSLILGEGLVVQGQGTLLSVNKRSSVKMLGSRLLSLNESSEQVPVIVRGKECALELKDGEIVSGSEKLTIDCKDGGKFLMTSSGVLTSSDTDSIDSTMIQISGITSSGFMTGESTVNLNSRRFLELKDHAQYSIESGHLYSTNTGHMIEVSDAVLRIIGGQFNSQSEDSDALIIHSDSQSSIEIVGGSFEANHRLFNDCADAFSLQGGKFFGDVPESLIPEGKHLENGLLVDDDESDSTSPEKPYPDIHIEIDPEYITGTVILKKSVVVYRNPSRNHPCAECIGTVRFLDGVYSDKSGDKYKKVRFKLPGSGVVAEGYVLLKKIQIYGGHLHE